jgi:hypothetical protein
MARAHRMSQSLSQVDAIGRSQQAAAPAVPGAIPVN